MHLLFGLFFGTLLVKSEVVSWFRIQEMFRFQSFHMYGVIGSAIVVGALSVALIKHFKLKTIHDEAPPFTSSEQHSTTRSLVGGTIFGLGWALLGACPGPIYALIGSGLTVMLVALASALAGTWAYGALRPKLPH